MRIDVEKELAVCVRGQGGVVLADRLPKNPTFRNADYWFPTAQVVAELKCLTVDPTATKQMVERTSRLYRTWVDRGLVPPLPAGRAKINTRNLPEVCARELIEPIKKNFAASTIRGASRQIKETKSHLNAPDAKGLLILVNDGNRLLTPEATGHLLARVLNGPHPSINSVVYFSVNELVSGPGIIEPSCFWCDFVVPGRVAIDREFREAFRAAWMSHLSTLVPGFVVERAGPRNPAQFSEMRFVRPDAA